MEDQIQIKTNDDHLIEGVLNSKQKSNKLIIFVHGLTGHKNEHHFFNAVKYFTSKGFDTFRFDLYSYIDKGRKLRDCSIKTHSKDLEVVIKRFENTYEELYLVGHSIGGPTVLWADHKRVNSVVLWDPSYKILDDIKDELVFVENLNLYLVNWGVEYLLSKEMVEDFKLLDERLLDYFSKPTKIICAEKGVLDKVWKKNIESINVKNDFVIVKNAGHCFDEEGTEQVLFEETLKWFDSNF